MSSAVDLHVVYQIANAPISEFPFPHIYVRDVFPPDFYRELRAHLPPKESLKTLTALSRVTGSYPDSRLVLALPGGLGELSEPLRAFWDHLAQWMLGGGFGRVMVYKFRPFLEQRLGSLETVKFHDEALIVQDYTTYSLGPHTDSPQKALSFLFYLPADDALSRHGTSIYAPKDPGFLCAGGPHHPFDKFGRMATMPFLPNSMFAFVKTHNSFHGVEPLAEAGVRRDLLLYDIKVENPPELARPPAGTQASAAAPARFSF